MHAFRRTRNRVYQRFISSSIIDRHEINKEGKKVTKWKKVTTKDEITFTTYRFLSIRLFIPPPRYDIFSRDVHKTHVYCVVSVDENGLGTVSEDLYARVQCTPHRVIYSKAQHLSPITYISANSSKDVSLRIKYEHMKRGDINRKRCPQSVYSCRSCTITVVILAYHIKLDVSATCFYYYSCCFFFCFLISVGSIMFAQVEKTSIRHTCHNTVPTTMV